MWQSLQRRSRIGWAPEPHRFPLDYAGLNSSHLVENEHQTYPLDLYLSLPLDQRKCETLVLELEPGRLNSELTGTLRVMSLQEQACSDYQALSYTWGSASPGKAIRINQAYTLPLTDNLFNALKRLRGYFKKLTIWVDAICINQASNSERGHQVSFMDRIFSNATSVIVWLGEPSEDDVNAGGWWNRRTVAIGSALQNTEPCWHERAWVTQEFIHARKRYICAGTHLFEYNPHKLFRLARKANGAYPENSDMYKDLRGGNRIQALEQKLARMKALGDYRTPQGQPGRPDMFQYQRAFRQISTYATDSRDLVYSLLSLITAEEAYIIGSDYSITTSQVYAKATYASFIARRNFDLLTRRDLSSIEGLPSWVLDFSAPPSSTILPRTAGSSSEILQLNDQNVRLGDGLLSLHVTGYCLGHIRKTMSVDTNDRFIRSRFATAFFSVLRDLRLSAGAPNKESGLRHLLASLLTPIPDPDLDRWLFRMIEKPSSNGKILVTALLQYWNDVVKLPEQMQACKDINDDLLEYVVQYCKSVSSGTSVFVTDAGLIGLAPEGIAKEDKIWLLPGAGHLVILRQGWDGCIFHGLAYIHGLVNGQLIQMLHDGLPQLEEITLV